MAQKHESVFLALTKPVASQGDPPRPQLAQHSWTLPFTALPCHHVLPQWPRDGGKS